MINHPSTVVIADDDEDDIVLLEGAIRSLYPEVKITTVKNGLKLLLLLNKLTPDVVFLDINMPVKTGIECLKEMKANEKLSTNRVVVYSTSNNPLEIDESYRLGANYYFVKPHQQNLLIHTLEALFNNPDFWAGSATERNSFLVEHAIV